MRPGCLILTATILRSSIKASRRQNIVHQGGATSCWLNTSRSRSSFTPYTEHLKLIAYCCLRKPKSVRCRQIPACNLTGNVGADQDGRDEVDEKLGFPSATSVPRSGKGFNFPQPGAEVVQRHTDNLRYARLMEVKNCPNLLHGSFFEVIQCQDLTFFFA